jgi:hypothetical protein
MLANCKFDLVNSKLANFMGTQKFLVDTGSSYSILPHRSSAPQSGPLLCAANNRRIRCWGYRSAAMAVNGRRYEWNFLLADVRFPIIGIDFLRQFQLVVDVCQERLLPRDALAVPVGNEVFAVAPQAVSPAAPVPPADSWTAIFEEFPSVSQPFSVQTKRSNGVKHIIETAGRPAMAKFRRLDPTHLSPSLPPKFTTSLVPTTLWWTRFLAQLQRRWCQLMRRLWPARPPRFLVAARRLA